MLLGSHTLEDLPQDTLNLCPREFDVVLIRLKPSSASARSHGISRAWLSRSSAYSFKREEVGIKFLNVQRQRPAFNASTSRIGV